MLHSGSPFSALVPRRSEKLAHEQGTEREGNEYSTTAGTRIQKQGTNVGVAAGDTTASVSMTIVDPLLTVRKHSSQKVRYIVAFKNVSKSK